MYAASRPVGLDGDLSVAGDINIAAALQDTLDEPVSTTLLRDLKAIFSKFYHVLLPHKSRRLLHDWDLWGPLLLTVCLALLLRSNAADSQKTQIFTGVFFIIWCGSTVITINNKLLGGTLSFFQGVCVLGYCVLPLVVSCILLRFVSAIISHLSLRLVVVAVGFSWSIWASVGFLGNSGPDNRKALIVYPIVLFYFVLAWLIVNDAPTH
eukprot:m.87041 g.87041  ORF g.87041 m.87041 type:complete len:209 (+) comp21377_c0_seq1:704-1330(+)